MQRCTQCGYPLDDTTTVCPNCRQTVRNTTTGRACPPSSSGNRTLSRMQDAPQSRQTRFTPPPAASTGSGCLIPMVLLLVVIIGGLVCR